MFKNGIAILSNWLKLGKNLYFFLLYQGPEGWFFFLLPPLPRSFWEGLEAPVVPDTAAGTPGAEPVWQSCIAKSTISPKNLESHSGLTWPRTQDVTSCKTCHHHSQVSKKLLERTKFPQALPMGTGPTLLPSLTSVCLNVNRPGKKDKTFNNTNFGYCEA